MSVDQHNKEIHENLDHWRRKPALRAVYADFYRAIAERLQGAPAGLVVECGSGAGNLKSTIPMCIATDLFPNPWIDRTENVFALSFPNASVGAVVLFDAFHHLEHPGAGLAELHRVLVPGGRVVIMEPGMGLLGRVVLGLFHHEPLALGASIAWEPPPGWDPGAVGYYAAQGNAWRIFVCGEFRDQLAGWRVAEVKPIPAFPWLLTGGFRGPQLCPNFAFSLARAIELCFSLFPRFFASRLLVVLEKNPL